MTATKRRQPILFALVCALFLIGGSPEDLAANPSYEDADWVPKVTGVFGYDKSVSERQFYFQFTIPAMKWYAAAITICAQFEHILTSGVSILVDEECGGGEVHDMHNGNFQSPWLVPHYWGSKNNKIKKTRGVMRVKFTGMGYGTGLLWPYRAVTW